MTFIFDLGEEKLEANHSWDMWTGKKGKYTCFVTSSLPSHFQIISKKKKKKIPPNIEIAPAGIFFPLAVLLALGLTWTDSSSAEKESTSQLQIKRNI